MRSNDFLILDISEMSENTPNREMALKAGKKIELRLWNKDGSHSKLLRRFRTRQEAEVEVLKLCTAEIVR